MCTTVETKCIIRVSNSCVLELLLSQIVDEKLLTLCVITKCQPRVITTRYCERRAEKSFFVNKKFSIWNSNIKVINNTVTNSQPTAIRKDFKRTSHLVWSRTYMDYHKRIFSPWSYCCTLIVIFLSPQIVVKTRYYILWWVHTTEYGH